MRHYGQWFNALLSFGGGCDRGRPAKCAWFNMEKDKEWKVFFKRGLNHLWILNVLEEEAEVV